MLKLATGKDKGRTLLSTKQARELRPTQSLVREALISMLNSLLLAEGKDFSQIQVLDIFAGIGTVGMEFLSNSAESVFFIEKDPKCVSILRANIEKLNYISQAKILAKPCLPALEQLKDQGFDVIFADPPYKQTESMRVIEQIVDKKLLKKRGFLIWESGDKNFMKSASAVLLEHFFLCKQKSYGDSFLFVFQENSI